MWKSHSASRIGTTADQRVLTTAHISLSDLIRGSFAGVDPRVYMSVFFFSAGADTQGKHVGLFIFI